MGKLSLMSLMYGKDIALLLYDMRTANRPFGYVVEFKYLGKTVTN
jgi:hypothetical protein